MVINSLLLLSVTLILSFSFAGFSFGQVTWNTFQSEDGVFLIQTPSNWNPEELFGEEKFAPIDYIFRYADRGDSFAWLELMIGEQLYPNARMAAESYISEYQQFEDFRLLEPINCERYILNGEPACHFLSSQQLEGEEPRTVLDIVSISPIGIQTDVIYITSSDIYDTFLPVGEFMIDSIEIDAEKASMLLMNQSTLGGIIQPPEEALDSSLPEMNNLTSQEKSPIGDVVDSKYLTISDHRYRESGFVNQVTGIITNVSSEEIDNPRIFVALYDANDQLISMVSGFAAVSPLPPNDNSSFSVSLYGLGEEDIVDHYTIFSGGLP